MPRNELVVRITPQADTVTVVLVGEAHFDFDAADKYIQNVMVHAPKQVIVDASGLTFMSSVGMCFLLSLRRAVKDAGGSLKIASLQPMVRQALEYARVIHLFELLPPPPTT